MKKKFFKDIEDDIFDDESENNEYMDKSFKELISIIKEKEKELEILKSTNTKLNEEMDKLDKGNQKLKQKNVNLGGEIQQLKTEVDTAKKEVGELKKNYVSEISSLSNKIINFENIIKNQDTILKDIVKHNKELLGLVHGNLNQTKPVSFEEYINKNFKAFEANFTDIIRNSLVEIISEKSRNELPEDKQNLGSTETVGTKLDVEKENKNNDKVVKPAVPPDWLDDIIETIG